MSDDREINYLRFAGGSISKVEQINFEFAITWGFLEATTKPKPFFHSVWPGFSLRLKKYETFSKKVLNTQG